MTKRPYIQFFPSDWRNDAPLQSCSISARALWLELICVMHECSPYGHLVIGGSIPNPAQVARLVGVDLKQFKKLMSELEKAGVPRFLPTGVMYSKRMVEDEKERGGWRDRQAGHRLSKRNVTPDVTPNVTSDVTRDVTRKSRLSSSSSSTSDSLRESTRAPDPPKSGKAKPLPTEFPTPELVQEATEFWKANDRADINAQHQSDQFRDKAAADGWTSQNWDAKWRTWMRNALQFNRHLPQPPGPMRANGHHHLAKDYTTHDDKTRAAVARFKKSGLWLSTDGAPPGDPDCTVPKNILAEFGL